MAETIRDVIIKIKLEKGDVEVAPPDTTAAEEALEGFKTTATEASAKAAENFETMIGEALGEVQEDIAATAGAVEDMGAQTSEHMLKVGDSFRSVGDGAFTFARGVALSFAASEESMQEMLKTVAKIQGAFDIYKGGLEVVKGLREGVIALAAANVGEAAAEGASAAATATDTAEKVVNTEVTVANAAASQALAKAKSGLAAVITPTTIAVAGLAVGVKLLTDEYVKNAEAALVAAGGGANVKRFGIDRLENQRALIAASKEEERVKKDLARIEGSSSTSKGQAEALTTLTATEKIANLEANRNQVHKEILESMGKESKEALALSTANRVDTVEGRAPTTRLLRDDVEFIQKTVNQQKAMGLLVSEELDYQRDKLGLIKAQSDARVADLQKQQQSIDLAKQALEAEDARVRSLDQIIGRMSKAEQIEFKRLEQKAQDGTFTKRDEDRLRQLAGGADVVQQFLGDREAERGKQSGLSFAGFDKFGRSRRGEGSEQQRLEGKLESELDQTEGKDISQLIKETLAKRKADEEAATQRIAELIAEDYASKSALERLEKRLEEARRIRRH